LLLDWILPASGNNVPAMRPPLLDNLKSLHERG
jgi:hypothetical protein